MLKKFAYSTVFVFLTLFLLKVGSDVCLPYRSSAILPLLTERDTFYCQAMADWDQYSRIKRTEVFEVLAVKMSQMEKDAINPSVVGWGDLLLFWRIPLILPLITEQVPEYAASSIKLICFAFSSSIFIAIILYYISLIFKAFTELGVPRTGHTPSAQEERVTSLMGRTNSSNNIVTNKKQR